MGRVVELPGRKGLFIKWTDANGRRRHRKVKGGAREAARVLREVEATVLREKLELPREMEEKPLAELVKHWRAHLAVSRVRPRTWELYRTGLTEVFEWLKRRGKTVEWADDLRPEDLREYAEAKLAQHASPRTVNMRIGAVRALLFWSEDQGYIRRNPLAKWKPIRHETPHRRRALTEIEIARLLAASPQADEDRWRFILGTGVRAGELATLEWPDVDWEKRQILIRAEIAKSRRERWIPLRADMIPILRRQHQRKAERRAEAEARLKMIEAGLAKAMPDARKAWWSKRLARAKATVETAGRLVFANSAGGCWDGHLSRRIKPCLKAAGFSPEDVEDIDLHTLRHTFASHLVAAGVDLKTVGDLLGHTHIAVTAIYLHPFEQRKVDAVEKVPIPGGTLTEGATKRQAPLGIAAG